MRAPALAARQGERERLSVPLEISRPLPPASSFARLSLTRAHALPTHTATPSHTRTASPVKPALRRVAAPLPPPRAAGTAVAASTPAAAPDKWVSKNLAGLVDAPGAGLER